MNFIKKANSASFCDKSGRFVARFVNEPLVLFPRSQLHNPDFSSKILEFASCNRNAESRLDSADSQNLVKKSLLKFLLLFAFAKRRIPLNITNSNSQSRVKSSKNNPCVSTTQNSPASWCKKSDLRLQKCNRRFFARSGESEALPLKAKSGSFWRVGGAGQGVQPFCEKESSKISKNGGKIAESSLDSTESQNLIKKINKKSLQKFLLLFAFAKSRIPLNPIIARRIIDLPKQSTPFSSLRDSAIRRIVAIQTNQSSVAQPLKSFATFCFCKK